jgi:hypothetical protein
VRLEGGSGAGGQGQFLTRILAQYPAVLDIAMYLSLNKLLGLHQMESHCMAAWKHYRTWDPKTYQAYRKYVGQMAPRYRGKEHLDCADLSIILLIKFAAEQGLPVTFWDNDQVRYISKGTRQTPEDPRVLRTRDWKNEDVYTEAVLSRVGAKALVQHNTVINPRGPETGDLMAKLDHAALVFAVYPPSVIHRKTLDKRIPVFPGHDIAKKQLNQTEYIRTPETTPWPYIDYLNHRGFGKERAELMYHASAQKMEDEGFEFRMYKPGVIDNWIDWNGIDDPPR